MSAVEGGRESLAGLTLDAVLSEKRRAAAALAPTANQINRTLLDIIRDEDPSGGSHGHKKSWKAFRDKLRLKRAGAAWTSSVHIPASDIPIRNNNDVIRSPFSRRNSVRFTTMSSNSPSWVESSQDNAHRDDSSNYSNAPPSNRPQMNRFGSTRYGMSLVPPDSNESSDDANINAVGDAPPARSFRPQISRHNSTRLPASNSDSNQPGENEYEPAREGTRRLAAELAEERQLSAREAVAAQEASEAAAAAAAEGTDSEGEEDNEAEEQSGAGQQVRMSLMDLLEENDRELGLEGSTYRMGDEEEEFDDDDDYDEDVEEWGGGGVEYNCCVCMVRHKGAAFIPCGHTFCRLCSRELFAQRGNCPLCNGFILEILDIF
ncbi:zinc finger family protein [Tripterygium wilfordii]|uniref:Zinc finger family protein n=2 Tax=Tripterygium wilfordii TaxID=458696 RepID=A0A7J7D4K3_TRIWF|nr:uncharacterized protein LOC120006986 isoform X2 [Tripterygium wilfordii]XP_038713045.1 uncharacterized protein LOC120006986 isoform X2 [Tripterygium wilfordii]KAF5741270.1 zinc finger family protein [Tripterygium wilfordii]